MILMIFNRTQVFDHGINECRAGVSFCGLKNQKYPDARAMGYPFDRSALPSVRSLDDFLTPNMNSQDIKIFFTDTLKERKIY